MYRGIDLSAHIGCQREREASFAVCETGFDDIRADDAVPIAIAIASQGGLISEYTPETSISRGGFKQSNRILAGMVQAVVITELYSHSARTLDLLKFCHQIGKLAFILIDPEQGVLSDEAALKESVTYGALPMVGKDKLQDIAMSLV